MSRLPNDHGFPLLTTLLIIFACSTFLSVSDTQTKSPDTDGRDQAPIIASVQLLGTKYCEGDADFFMQVVRVRILLVNSTERRLIVSRFLGQPFQKLVIASDAAHLAAAKYEYNPINDLSSSPPLRPVEEASPTDAYVFLAPRDTFHVDSSFQFEVRLTNRMVRGDWPLRPGNHVAQLELITWPAPGDPKEVADRWRSFGDLVYAAIKTEPYTINVPAHPDLEDCRKQ